MKTSMLRAHWFFLAAPVIIGIDLTVALHARGQFDSILEAGLLFDLVILVPSLYWLCYRGRGRSAITRAAALSCLGVWAALKFVPEAEQDLVRYVAPLRYLGLGALILLEIVVVLGIYRSVFSGKSTDEAVANAPKDLPAGLARLMALEAAFWSKAWRALKRLVGRPE